MYMNRAASSSHAGSSTARTGTREAIMVVPASRGRSPLSVYKRHGSDAEAERVMGSSLANPKAPQWRTVRCCTTRAQGEPTRSRSSPRWAQSPFCANRE